MATREQVLDTAKDLLVQLRDLSAGDAAGGTLPLPPSVPSNPFDQVSGTPALDALKLNGNVISTSELNTLLAQVEAAKTNEDDWITVAKALGAFAGALAKAFLVFLVAALFVGCATPLPVKQAEATELQAFVAFKKDHDAIVTALLSDLALALENEIQLIENYEIRAKGATVAQADLMTLLNQARAKRADIAKKMEAHRAMIATADGNYQIALEVHAAVSDFLGHDGITVNDLDTLLSTVLSLVAKQVPAVPASTTK